MRLMKSTAIIGSLTLLSRVLGLIRDILMARYLGAGLVNDALITATKLPNLFRRMFAEGAFNAAFIPLYAKRLEGEGEDSAAEFAGEAFSALFLLVALIVVIFQLTMPISLNLIGGGLERVASTDGGLVPYDLAVLYARLTMPYLLLMSLAALFSGMLNTKSYFAISAIVPVMLNLVWIGLLLSQTIMDLPEHVLARYLALGMTVSGVMQVGLLLYGLKRASIALPLRRPRLTPGIKRLFTLGVPGLIAAGITQLNLLVSHNIATQQASAPSWLYYSDRLYQLPLGMIGIALGIALLPSLSRSLRSNNESEAMTTLNRAGEIAAFLTLPAACALFVMPEFLISTLFECRAFKASDSVQTAKALKMFAVGLPAFVLIKVLTPTFFAREDTRTPMIYACVSAVINLILGYMLFYTIGFFGLALATSVAAWANVGCLAVTQKRRGHFKVDARLLLSLPKMVIASAVMGVALWFIVPKASAFISGHKVMDYLVMIAVCGIGGGIYLIAAIALKTFSLKDMRLAFKKS